MAGSVAGSVRGAREARLRALGRFVLARPLASNCSGSGNFKLECTNLQGPTATEADLPLTE